MKAQRGFLGFDDVVVLVGVEVPDVFDGTGVVEVGVGLAVEDMVDDLKEG